MFKIGLILTAIWIFVWTGIVDDKSKGIFATLAKVTSETFGGIPHLFLIVGIALMVLGVFKENKNKEENKRKALGYNSESTKEQNNSNISSGHNKQKAIIDSGEISAVNHKYKINHDYETNDVEYNMLWSSYLKKYHISEKKMDKLIACGSVKAMYKGSDIYIIDQPPR